MDKVLSYNQKSNGEDWFSLTGQYNEDDIKAIKDPNGGQAENPKTAIPLRTRDCWVRAWTCALCHTRSTLHRCSITSMR